MYKLQASGGANRENYIMVQSHVILQQHVVIKGGCRDLGCVPVGINLGYFSSTFLKAASRNYLRTAAHLTCLPVIIWDAVNLEPTMVQSGFFLT